MQSRQLAKVLDPFSSDRKLTAVVSSGLAMCISPAHSAPAQSTTWLLVPMGFPPGTRGWVRRRIRSTSQSCRAGLNMNNPNALIFFFLFFCFFFFSFKLKIFTSVLVTCRKNLYFLFMNLYLDLLAAKFWGFFYLSVFHLSAAFVFPLSCSRALCPRQVSEIKD